MQAYEKLGSFYLGREHDLAAHATSSNDVLYDSKDLVTHAVCVGMTGSGKTGLCLAILEEAAIDGVPAIVIDPKGDLTNLLLTFPDLKPEDFRPWINPDDARKAGKSEDEFAAEQAKRWAEGLAKWNQDGDRIRRMKGAADFTIYTPGSSSGIPISIVKSFDAPERSIVDDSELFAERISSTATSLLGLLGIDADPIQSREHILVSNILSSAWSAGEHLDIAALIGRIQSPPMKKVGVLDVDAFFPQKDRLALAMRLNNLLAAPAFAQWMNGVPLDVQSMLYASDGRPRIAIVSIAHLGDAERMFFVSLLLNQVLGWMRTQGGTTSLRAILYMDEIFGYFPPTANPPSKQPLLTLLKQGRAFGLGVMLATQNPVDLDYKGLSNCGTWFVGRLQTERDKARLLEGLEGAAAGANAKFDAARMGETLAGLGNRVFLMNNVHDDAPIVFESRWAMSYLRGPLGKPEIKRLTDPVRAKFVAAAQPKDISTPAGPTETPQAADGPAGTEPPLLSPTIPQYFLPLRGGSLAGAALVYLPKILGTADVTFADKSSGFTTTQQRGLLADVTDNPVPVEWSEAIGTEVVENDLERSPQPNARFVEVPGAVSKPKQFEALKKAFSDALYRTAAVEMYRAELVDRVSTPGESEASFRIRCSLALREERDAAMEATRRKYRPKLDALEERHRRAMQRVEAEAAQASSAKWSAALSVAGSILGAVLGNKKRISSTTVTRGTSAARSAKRAMQQSSDVGRAEETVHSVESQLAELNAQLQADLDAIAARYDPAALTLVEVPLRPKKSDVKPRLVALVWAPYWKADNGKLDAAWA